MGPDANPRDVEYTAKGDVLPVRHVLVLRDKTAAAEAWPPRTAIPSWVQDYALYLLDPEGRIVAWYSGAARIYGYQADEAIGQHVSLSLPWRRYCSRRNCRMSSSGPPPKAIWELKAGSRRKDGSRFWANAITMALKDENGELQGFARVVRDFSDRHERDEKLRRSRARIRPIPARIDHRRRRFGRVRPHSRGERCVSRHWSATAARICWRAGCNWPDLTPPEYAALDELAHEEGLRFGACTPFEKELIRKDGTRVPVLVATAVLKLSPFRWITFVQDLRERDRMESIETKMSNSNRISRRWWAPARPCGGCSGRWKWWRLPMRPC